MRIVSKITWRLSQRLFLSTSLKILSLFLWTPSFNYRKNTLIPRLISWLPRTSKSKELLMIYYKPSCSILLTLMLIPFFLRKPSVSKDITSGISIKLCSIPPKTPSTLWNIVSVVRRFPVPTLCRTWNLSSRSKFNWMVIRLPSIPPYKKFKSLLIVLQLLSSDAPSTYTIGINRIRIPLIRLPSTIWLLATKKSLRLSSSWLVPSKVLRIKSMNS